MKTSLGEISAVKKKLSVEIESQEVEKKLNEAYRDLRKKAKIPGFRQGKVPIGILEKHFGDQVADDVTRALINETFPKALDEVKTFPLGAPLLEKEPLKKGEDFKYSAVMEVRPQFDVNNYTGLEIEQEKCSVTDDDIEDQLDKIRKAGGKMVAIEEKRPVRKDDYVVLDYESFENGKPLEDIKASNFLIKVGSGDFHTKFEEGLIGLSKEEEKEIEVDFEDSFYHSKLASKKILFNVKITDIKDMVTPELNDEFARGLGADFNDLEDLRTKVRENTIAQEEKRINKDLRQRLVQKIAATVNFELPQVLVENEIDYAVESVKQNLVRSGADLERVGLSEEKLRNDFRSVAEKRVKELLVLGEITKKENISINEEELAEGFKELAATTGQDIETLRKYYEARDMVGSLRENLLQEKTLNYLVENANIIQVEKGAITQNPSEKEN